MYTWGLITGAILVLTGTGYFIFKRINVRNRQKDETKSKQEQLDAVRCALEIFQPFHWEALHVAIASEEFRRKEQSPTEKNGPDKIELIKAYSTAYSSLQNELKNLDGTTNLHKIDSRLGMLPVNLRDEVHKLVQTLGEACRLAQEQQDLKECFSLVETAYRESAQIEKKLRSLIQKLS